MAYVFWHRGLSRFTSAGLALGILALPVSVQAETASLTSAAIEARNQTSNEARIRQLTEQWFAAWSPGREPMNWEAMGQLFAQEPGDLLVFDDAGGRVVVLSSWEDYRATWEPFMEAFSEWQIDPEGDIRVTVEGDLATTVFTLTGGGLDQAGNAVRFRQYGTHIWQRIGDRWVIVHEHLTTDK